MLSFALLAAGVVALAVVADRFVDVAAKLSAAFGVSAVAVGVVVMGFGTSLPELLVSVQAALTGRPQLAAGNVIGSNVVNLSIVLGAGALVRPLVVHGSVVRREAPAAVAATAVYTAALLWLLTPWSAVAGVVLIVGGGVFVLGQLRKPPPGDDPFLVEVEIESASPPPSRRRLVLLSVVYLAGVVAAAQALLWGAEGVAGIIGLSETATGIVLLAVGTSLPELASVVAAARRGEHELIAGNLLGSTLFNSAFVGGLALAVGSAPAIALLASIAPVAVAAVAWAAMRNNLTVSRLEGAALVVAGLAVVVAISV